jgi:hypothetical protein
VRYADAGLITSDGRTSRDTIAMKRRNKMTIADNLKNVGVNISFTTCDRCNKIVIDDYTSFPFDDEERCFIDQLISVSHKFKRLEKLLPSHQALICDSCMEEWHEIAKKWSKDTNLNNPLLISVFCKFVLETPRHFQLS